MTKPHYIREWRKYRNLSQEALAGRIDKTQSYISKLEKFSQEYNQPTLEALAYALMCEPADLIMRDPSQQSSIWSIWDKVPETERGRVIEIIETFTRKVGT